MNREFLQRSQEKRDLFFAILIVGCVLVMHTYTFFKHLSDESIWIDGYGYLMGAWWLKEHFSFTERLMKTQAYVPVFIIAFFQSIVDEYLSAKYMNFFFALIGLVVMFALGKEIKGPLAGGIAVLVFFSIPIIYYLNKRSLVDFPLGVMYIATTYFYIRLLKYKKKKDALLTGTMLALTFLTKSAGVILVVVLVLHYLLVHRVAAFKKKESYYIALPAVLFVAPVVIMNMIYFHKPVASPDAFSSIIFKAEDYMYYLRYKTMQFYAPLTAFILAAYGIYRFYRQERMLALYFILLFAIYFVSFSLVKFQDARFMAPLCAVIALFCGYAVEDLKRQYGDSIRIIYVFLFLMCASWIVKGEMLVKNKADVYTGYREIEEFLELYGINNSSMYVSSTWTMEFVTRRFYENPFERVKHLKKAGKTLEELNLTVSKCIARYEKCYVEMDMWEPTQPYYTYYFHEIQTYFSTGKIESMKTIQNLMKIGLRPAFISYKEVKSLFGKPVKVPAVILMESTS